MRLRVLLASGVHVVMVDGGSGAPRSAAQLAEAATGFDMAFKAGLMSRAQLDSAMVALRAEMEATLAALGAAPAVPVVGAASGNLSEPLAPQATPAATPHDSGQPRRRIGAPQLGRASLQPAERSAVAAAVRRVQQPVTGRRTSAPAGCQGIMAMPGFTFHRPRRSDGVLERVLPEPLQQHRLNCPCGVPHRLGRGAD